MGLAYSHLKLIHNKVSERGTLDKILTLGRQTFDVNDRRIENLMFSEIRNYDSRMELKYADEFFLEAGWAKRVDSIDISGHEGSTIVHDLNQNINFSENYDLIIDGGTLEHVYNLPVALKNIHKLLRIGGCILHFKPANNYLNHGFYQFSPVLFAAIYRKINGFRDTKIFLMDTDFPAKLFEVQSNYINRVEIRSKSRIEIICYAMKFKNVIRYSVNQLDYENLWINDGQRSSDRRINTKSTLLYKIRTSLKDFLIIKKCYLIAHKILFKVKSSLTNFNKNLIKINITKIKF